MKKILRYTWITLRETFWVAVSVAIVGGGYFGFQYLGETREIVEPAAAERPVTLVETGSLAPLDGPLPIRGEGFVKPFRQLSVSAQVGGRIVELHPAIANRGTFAKGDILARLDDSTERAALAQTEANIAGTQARIDLNATELTRSQELRERGVVAQTRIDQLLSTEAELFATLESLQAARLSAQIALENKVISAPFDGAVLSKSAEIGTVVGGGQAIAEIFTIDRMEVDVAVREADAALIPGLFSGAVADGQGHAQATIRFAGRSLTWDAHIARVEPQLDPSTRTLTVTLALDTQTATLSDGSSELASGAPPALINAFAKVVIDGISPPNTYQIPSTALRGGDTIWLAQDDTLAVHPARALHVDGEMTFVQITDLDVENAQLIQTALSTPVPGMAVRSVAQEARGAALSAE